MRTRFFLLFGGFFLIAAACDEVESAPATKRPFTFEDMMSLKRLSEPVPAPDGKWVVFAAQDVDLEANTKKSHLWVVPVEGGAARRLNQSPNEEERPRFSPDGKRLMFTSKATDPSQIWMCDFDSTNGALSGAPHQVTNLSTGADGGIWSPDGKNIVFVSEVYPDCADDACNKARSEELKNSKVKAKIFTHLLYRHWNAFSENKRSHLFVVSAEADARSRSRSHRPRAILRREIMTFRRFILADRICTAFPQTGRRWPTRATLMKSKRPVQQRNLRCADQRRLAKEDFNEPWKRFHSRIAGRSSSRLAFDGARRLRSGSQSLGRLRSQVGTNAVFDRRI